MSKYILNPNNIIKYTDDMVHIYMQGTQKKAIMPKSIIQLFSYLEIPQTMENLIDYYNIDKGVVERLISLNLLIKQSEKNIYKYGLLTTSNLEVGIPRSLQDIDNTTENKSNSWALFGVPIDFHPNEFSNLNSGDGVE